MQQITTWHDFDAPAALLWELLADFANIERWWPRDDVAVQIARVELEGEGIGLIRHIFNVGFPVPVSERLDYQNPVSMTYRLSIVGDRPAGILSYQATGRIEALAGNHSRLHYTAEFTAQSARTAEAEAFLSGAYALMFKGLAEALARQAAAS
jgi:uncharacterized protein YndB with AHSA1/START domain